MDLRNIEEAAARIKDWVFRTPLKPWRMSETENHNVYFKFENFQRTGSFKARGGCNKLFKLKEQGKLPKVAVAASAGNHAQGVAYAAKHLGIKSIIVMPEGTPLIKVQSTMSYGAEVVIHGEGYHEAYLEACEIQESMPDSVYVHAFSDDDIIAGQGTVGLELSAQLANFGVDPTTNIQVVVPIGGGGLISGIACAIKAINPNNKVFGVVSSEAPIMLDSYKAGKILPKKIVKKTIAEGLAIKEPVPLTFGYIQEWVDDIYAVDDLEIASAITWLMEREKVVVEGAGAAGLAAVMSSKVSLDPDIPTVVILCGGNIDLNLVTNILEKSFLKSGHWATFEFSVEDKPGSLAKLADELSSRGANILDVKHNRVHPDCGIMETMLSFKVECRGFEHIEELKKHFSKQGYKVDVS